MQGAVSVSRDGKSQTQIAAEYLEKGFTPEEVVEIMKREKIFFPWEYSFIVNRKTATLLPRNKRLFQQTKKQQMGFFGRS